MAKKTKINKVVDEAKEEGIDVEVVDKEYTIKVVKGFEWKVDKDGNKIERL